MNHNLNKHERKKNRLFVFIKLGNTSIQFIAGSTKEQSTAANKGHFVKKSFTSTLGSNTNFQFNFPIDAMEKLSIEKQTETNGIVDIVRYVILITRQVFRQTQFL